MYGHNHEESFAVQTSMLEKKPIGLTFQVGAVTTYTNKNPSFNVIELDPKTLLPIDYYVYAMNLTEANKSPDQDPDWKVFYDYRKTYNMTDLSPTSWIENISNQIY